MKGHKRFCVIFNSNKLVITNQADVEVVDKLQKKTALIDLAIQGESNCLGLKEEVERKK